MEKFLTLLLLFSNPAFAKTKSSAPHLQQSYKWVDGETEKTVWLDPGYLAEFGAQEKAASNSAARVFADKQRIPRRSGGVMLWPMSVKAGGSAAVANLATKDPEGAYSEVFRDGPRSIGNTKALPGNIIIRFRPEWSESRIESYAKSQKLEIIRKLAIGANVYVLKHRPGLESLLKANEIRSSGEVLEAMPDWWINVKPL